MNVKEIEHVRGSRILTGRPKKAPSVPRWYDSTDPTTHDLPPKPENHVEDPEQTSSRELVLEDIELPDETATKHLVISGGTGPEKRKPSIGFWTAFSGGRATEKRRSSRIPGASSGNPGAKRPISSSTRSTGGLSFGIRLPRSRTCGITIRWPTPWSPSGRSREGVRRRSGGATPGG